MTRDTERTYWRRAIPAGLLLIWLLSLGASGAMAEEARAAWFHRWEWNDRGDIESTVANIDDCNMNLILFQIRGQGDAFYISDHEPWSTLVGSSYPGYDPLAVAIYEAHSRGLELHAYINAMPAWSGSTPHPSPDHIYNAHPEWIMVDEEGDPMDPAAGYVSISPAIPEAVQHVNDVIMDIATKYDVDGIHLDYIRYPNSAYSYDDSSLARFARDYDGCTPESCPGKWSAFRRTLITEVVEACHDSVTALKPWVKISAAVWGIFSSGYTWYFQDSHGWLEDGIMDFTAPMIYTSDLEDYGSRLRDHTENNYGRHVYGGIGIYLDFGTATMTAEIDSCRVLGAQGQTMFASSDLSGSYKSALLSGPYASPDAVPAMAWKPDPPFIASVALPVDSTHIDVLFNRDVDLTSGQNAANYTIDNGLTVFSAVRDPSDHHLIHLTTGGHLAGVLYTLTVGGVQDEGGKETAAWPNNQRIFYGSRSAPEIVVDNEDPSPDFVLVGSWSTGTYGNPYNDTYNWTYGDSGEHTATWTPDLPNEGIYDVFAYWVQGGNRATDAPYIINHLDGADTVRVNQEANGETWYPLGAYPFAAGTGHDVTLANDADEIVIADAVRWVYSGPLEPDAPPAAVDNLASTTSAGDITLTWSPVSQDTAGNPLSVDRYVIYRDDDPSAEPADSIGVAAGADYTDPGAAGSTGTNYYYVIRAVSDAKGKSAPSNTVGEFDLYLGNVKKAAAERSSPAAR